MLFTPAASDCCSFHFCFAFTVVPSAFSTLIFKHCSGRRAPSRYQGAEAAGDTPEGTLLKHVVTSEDGLGSGRGRRKEVVAL